MLAKVKSTGLFGMDGYIVDVEVDISNGLPAFDIVGLPDTAVKEAKERVRSAIRNSGLEFPMKRITVNLAPADTKKEGPAYDLAIAIGILIATEQLTREFALNHVFLGELSLDGSIKPIQGVLPMLLSVNGIADSAMLPAANAPEADNVSELKIIPVNSLSEVIGIFRGDLFPAICKNRDEHHLRSNLYDDFSDVKGQDKVKRALEIAAAGGHNALMIGPPGSGKTMLAKRLPSILPELTYAEAIEITKIYSAAGLLPTASGLVRIRPFRSPHHTISNAALVGGGKFPKPGEVSLAHHGVLFLDELPEFRRDVLEVLRQPLEDGSINISRANGKVLFPAKFNLIASMNPCPCGFFSDSFRACTCTPLQITRYFSKISGPLLDRIDIQVEASAVPFDKLSGARTHETSDQIRKRVNKTRSIQLERYSDLKIFCNAQLSPKEIDRYCHIDSQQKQLLKNAFQSLGLSARAYDRILKVSRTIADIEGSENIASHHLAEAIQYRSMDKYQKGVMLS